MATNHNQGQGLEGLQSFTNEQIEIAKSFIWEHLNDDNKKIIMLYATSETLKEHGIPLREIIIGFRHRSPRDY